MAYLLNLVYLVLLACAWPWLLYGALKKGKYREGWAARLLGRVPRRAGSGRCIWLHAVSVGEVNLLATLLPALESAWPDCECVISTSTKTGYDLARQRYAPRAVFYAPLDFSWAANEALRRVRPDLLILTELELWPNLIRVAKRRSTRVAVVNGRLGEKSFRGYRRAKWLLARTFGALDLVAAQTEEYAARFRALGAPAEAVHVTGSLKFDGAESNRQNSATRRLAELAGFASEDVVLLAGSTQHPEEQLALETFRCLAPVHPNLRLVLVPRHPERFEEVAALLAESGLPWRRRTNLERPATSGRLAVESEAEPKPSPGNASPESKPELAPRILLVDAVGELGAWWGTAHIAFVGGSLNRRGGQNMLEPAAYGAAVCFGPNTWNFKEIVARLLSADAARVVSSGAELTAFAERCLAEPEFASELGSRARRLVAEQQGATTRTLALLARLGPSRGAGRRTAA